MKVVRSDDHRKHFPKGELYGGEFVRPFECPERWEHIMDRLGERGFKDMLDPHALDMSPVRQIHDEGFLEFLETAWDQWQKAGYKGEILATVFTNPHWGGGITAALAYYAATGAFKPSDEPHEHREFYGPTIMITPKDAAEFKANYIDSVPTYDWKDFWGPAGGQIMYK